MQWPGQRQVLPRFCGWGWSMFHSTVVSSYKSSYIYMIEICGVHLITVLFLIVNIVMVTGFNNVLLASSVRLLLLRYRANNMQSFLSRISRLTSDLINIKGNSCHHFISVDICVNWMILIYIFDLWPKIVHSRCLPTKCSGVEVWNSRKYSR